MKDFLNLKKPFRGFLMLTLMVYALSSIFCAQLSAQNLQRKIDFACQNEPMPSVLKKVEQASGLKVLFTYNEVQNFKVTVKLSQKTVDQIMSAVTSQLSLSYKIEKGYISVFTTKRQANQGIIYGRVKDESGEPLPGVSVSTDNPTIGGITDAAGNFNITIPKGKKVKTVTFSFVGMQKVSVPFNGKAINIAMKDDAKAIDEVVVTGIFERKKEGFTGSANRMSGDDVRSLLRATCLTPFNFWTRASVWETI